MGVIHKLRPEVKDFILAQKKGNLTLSCRKLTALALNNFKIALSKSSINAIIKEAGLSAPVGRTPKKKRQRIVMPNLPILLEDASTTLSLRGTASEAKQDEAIPKNEIAPLPSVARNDDEKIRAEKEAEERKAQEEEAERKAKEEAQRKAAEEAAKKAEEEEAAKKAEEEDAAKKAAAEAAKKAEIEAAKKAEAEKWLKLAEEERRVKEEAEKKAREEAVKETLSAEEAGKAALTFDIPRIAQLENTGIVLLRAADYLFGVSKLIAAAIKNRLAKLEGNPEEMTEALIYLPLLQEKIEPPLLDKLSGYLNELENIQVMGMDMSRIMAPCLQLVRCVKVILSDGPNLYLDGQMYSVWSSQHIPYDFASPIYNLKKYINKYLNTDAPLILFNAPGYDMPPAEFFTFLASLESKGVNITNLVLYGNKFEELEVLAIPQAKKRSFIFGVWPWQFIECRKVKSLGEFRRFHLAEQNKDLYLADIVMELRHPNAGKQATLYGCAIKTSLKEKTRMVILSNLPPADKKAEELTAIYFDHWPNLEEAFQDYSRKIELFTYTANSQRYFNAEGFNLGSGQAVSVKELCKNYLAALDAYVRWHFLPSGSRYEDQAFSVTKERFYDLGVQLAAGNTASLANFILPAGYSFGKDLAYMSHRVNEKEVVLDGKRFLINT